MEEEDSDNNAENYIADFFSDNVNSEADTQNVCTNIESSIQYCYVGEESFDLHSLLCNYLPPP